MEPEVENAVNKLTREWSATLTPQESPTDRYQAVEYPPLLTMLERAKAGSMGTTTAGASKSAFGERSVLNLQALNLFEWIEGRTRAQLAELGTARYGETLHVAVRRLADTADALYRTNQLTESGYLTITGQFARWCDRIWDLFDPPTIIPLVGSCPACGNVHVVDAEGVRSSALTAFYADGFESQARCSACGEQWTGVRELLELGFHLGAAITPELSAAYGVSGGATR